MADKIVNEDALGEDSEKGGIFFGSNLTPAGTFSNIPKNYTYSKPSAISDGALVLTLEKIKDSLKEQLKEEDGAEADDIYLEKFLYQFTNLLIDYRDMRNYVFYGSANTELAYNIKTLIETFPYKFWVAALSSNLIRHGTVAATATVTITSVVGAVGDTIVINFNGSSLLCNYTKVAGDTTTKVAQGLAASIMNLSTVHGYTAETAGNVITITAPLLPGDELNGTSLSITYGFGNGTSTVFSGGVSSPPTDIVIENDIANNETHFIFSEAQIKDGVEQFNFFDNSTTFDWSKYEVVDKNDNRYEIKKVITPYFSDPDVLEVANISTGFIPDATDSVLNPPEFIPSFETMKIETSTNHSYTVGEVVSLLNVVLDDGTNLTGEYVVAHVPSSTEILVVNKYKVNEIQGGGKPRAFDSITVPSGATMLSNPDALIRLFPAEFNTRPYTIKMTIKGNYFLNYFISTVESQQDISGIIISPTKTVLSEFEFNLTQIQRMILAPAPINPNPWPRRPITNNIMNLLASSIWNQIEPEFVDWLQNPDFLYLKDGVTDSDLAFSDVYAEYRLVRALALDESETNQLVRRCIPQDMISELFDTPDADFQRFILIAGWFFDQFRVYIQFLKYVHHINHSDFNQLSPEYYRYWASHYGLDLFTDDGIDFSKLVVKTEPGLYFREKALTEKDTKFYRFTLQQLQYERQKRLLLSLFFLYKSKGTQATINKLVSLLGAPDGFFLLSEYAFKITNTDEFDYFDVNDMSAKRIVDNDKVYTPKYIFETDPFYPTTDPKMPPVYRMRLDNESTYNLRQISIQTNPNGAIDNQILNVFGKTKYKYGKFQTGEYANLQRDEMGDSWLPLPITAPDKFMGITVEYMIPRDGFKKGIGNNQEEANIHICSLYELGEFTSDPYTVKFAYPLPNSFANTNDTTWGDDDGDTNPDVDGHENVITDFNTLARYNQINEVDVKKPFIICRLEGTDLVVRARFRKEFFVGDHDPNPTFQERVAILPNVFSADGLNHTLRLLFRAEGCEVYKDYSHLGINNTEKIGIALWRDTADINFPSSPFFNALEIPKHLIELCAYSVLDISNLAGDSNNLDYDYPRSWDVFIGLPSNIDFYFKRVSIFENYSANSFDEADRMTNDKNFTAEFWNFSFVDNDSLSDTELKIRCEFSQVEPNINIADYSYQLPVEQFNNKLVIQDLVLIGKKLLPSFGQYEKKYYNIIQDFFNVNNVFRYNAWQSNIHQAYEYDNFNGKVIDLYNLYSPQVLTYQSLAPFLDLIENKFKPLIKEFIPIVINISEFGRLITNSLFIQPKMRYTNIHKLCEGKYLGQYSILQFRVFDVIQEGQDISIELDTAAGVPIIPPFPITWQGTETLTEVEILFSLRDPSVNPYTQYIKTYLNDGVLTMTIDAVWYNSFFGGSSNGATLTVRYIGIDAVPIVFTFDHGFSNVNPSECGSVSYSLPVRDVKDKWVYFKTENQPPTYITQADENNPDTTYLKFK